MKNISQSKGGEKKEKRKKEKKSMQNLSCLQGI
jgi:hypothetical protein